MCLPADVATEGRRRGYLPPGGCPGGAAPVLKRVGARGGNVVTIDADSVRVDGRWLQTPAPQSDRRGRPRAPWPPGVYELADGKLWLYTPEMSSWDSWYYRPVDRGRPGGGPATKPSPATAIRVVLTAEAAQLVNRSLET